MPADHDESFRAQTDRALPGPAPGTFADAATQPWPQMQPGLPTLPRRCRAVADGNGGRNDGASPGRMDPTISSSHGGYHRRRAGVERILLLLCGNLAFGRR